MTEPDASAAQSSPSESPASEGAAAPPTGRLRGLRRLWPHAVIGLGGLATLAWIVLLGWVVLHGGLSLVGKALAD